VGALNLGIAQARGQFVARMDADDISLPSRFEAQLHLMQEQNLDFCGTQLQMINSDGRLIKEIAMPCTTDLITITLACTVPFAHGSVMMRKDFLQSHALRYQTGASAEDYQFWCRAYHLGARFGNVDQFLYQYRYLNQSLSKVHAKVVHAHTSALRRQFVKDNLVQVERAIAQLAPVANGLNTRDATFLLLTAYLVFLQTQSNLLFMVARHSKLKAIGLAVIKILLRF
jgi:glycosyltransferase involved in cell wall biosynthesis